MREVRTNSAQISASQYERELRAAAPPYPAWYNYYRADPIIVPASLADSAAMETPNLSAHFFASAGRPRETTSLRLSAPTLVIWGLRDPAMLPGLLHGLEEYVQDLTVVRIDDAGHYPMSSHPGVVTKAMRDFVMRP